MNGVVEHDEAAWQATSGFAQLCWHDARMGRLADVDLSLKLDKAEHERRLAKLGPQLQELRLRCGGLIGDHSLGPPVCVLFEGWDASGKGGAIKRLVAPLDARHVRVAQFAAPTYDEKRHHFLSRFMPALPGWGGMAIFDRTWYGRVLVERVEGFATKKQWKRSYDEINQFEEMLAAEGTVFVKLWLHISDAEQLKRFEARRDDPLKAWKLTEEDWRNRAKRPEYEAAVEDMLRRNDTKWAPWTVVPAESKHYARVFVVEQVIKAMKRALRRQPNGGR
jgi:polyphosphate kinase 2 (PPK2 family)